MAQKCPPFGVYNFMNTALTIDGVMVQGYAEGDDAISIEPFKELSTPVVGADGASLVAINASQAATVTIKLLASAPMNKWLWNRVARMRSGALTGVTFALGFTDLSLGETGGCTTAIIQAEANIQRGERATDMEWKFFCPCWQPGTVDVIRN